MFALKDRNICISVITTSFPPHHFLHPEAHSPSPSHEQWNLEFVAWHPIQKEIECTQPSVNDQHRFTIEWKESFPSWAIHHASFGKNSVHISLPHREWQILPCNETCVGHMSLTTPISRGIVDKVTSWGYALHILISLLASITASATGISSCSSFCSCWERTDCIKLTSRINPTSLTMSNVRLLRLPRYWQ